MHRAIELIYTKIRLAHYRSLFGAVREKLGSLSATEAFSAEVIYLLDHPTINEFAEFIGISQPNASYKVNSLAAKGYIAKTFGDDKREHRLSVTDKFLDYYGRQLPFLTEAISAATENFTDAEIAIIEKFASNLTDRLGAAGNERN